MFATLEIAECLLARVKHGLHAYSNCTLFLCGPLAGFEGRSYRFHTATKPFCRETSGWHLLNRCVLSSMDPVYIAAISGVVFLIGWSLAVLVYAWRTQMGVGSGYYEMD
jgi:hypothetical protein